MRGRGYTKVSPRASIEEKKDGGSARGRGGRVVRGLFVSVSVYTASTEPLNQVERSRGLLCKLQPWLKSSALKYWMINQRERESPVSYSIPKKPCPFSSLAKPYQLLNASEKWTLKGELQIFVQPKNSSTTVDLTLLLSVPFSFSCWRSCEMFILAKY